MAVYNSGTVSSSGNNPNGKDSAAGGWQIGGGDMSDAWVSFELPKTYSSFDDCVVTFTFYARYSPSSWVDNWTCGFNIKWNSYNIGTAAMDYTDFVDSAYRTCTFTFYLTRATGAPAFSPGDVLRFTFVGDDGWFINDFPGGDGSCLYLKSGVFVANNAVEATKKKYLLVKSYSPANVSQYSSGTYYVSWADYRKYWGFSWEPYDYMLVTLDGNGGGYYSDVTYYISTDKYLTDSYGNRLYIPD